MLGTSTDDQGTIVDVPCSSAEMDFDFSNCFHEFDAQKDSDSQEQSDETIKFCIVKEVELYLSYKQVEKSSSPFQFWKMFCSSLPMLSTLSKKYLCCPPSSIESERLFSCGGNIYSSKRNRMNADTGEKLMFSHYNLTLQKLNQ